MPLVVKDVVVQRKGSEPEQGDEDIHLEEGVAGMGRQPDKGDRGLCIGMAPSSLLEPG